MYKMTGDSKAQGVALKAIFYGYWKSLTPLQTIFLPCMVLATAENIHFQVNFFTEMIVICKNVCETK